MTLPHTTSSAEVKERVELYIYSISVFRGLFQGELYLYLDPAQISAGPGSSSVRLGMSFFVR